MIIFMTGKTHLNAFDRNPTKFKVYQHWDPLKICIVGKSYPPEFYSFLKNSKIRKIFEKLAVETEEDFQLLIKKLQDFGVEVLRPNISPSRYHLDLTRQQYREPPMTPRDDHIMIGDKFFKKDIRKWEYFYNSIRDKSWPQFPKSIDELPIDLQKECREVFGWGLIHPDDADPYYEIIQKIKKNGNHCEVSPYDCINGASVARLGKDLVIGIDEPLSQVDSNRLSEQFSDYKLHLMPIDGHLDGTYCPVCPGLLITHRDAELYQKTFPDWEVLRLDPSLESIPEWIKYRNQTRGRWWLPNFASDPLLINVVETYLNRFVGFVEETCFEVNMLMLDPHNAVTFYYNKEVEKTLQRYNINLHVIPFRHRYFWDGGAHCVTCDINRQGEIQKIL